MLANVSWPVFNHLPYSTAPDRLAQNLVCYQHLVVYKWSIIAIFDTKLVPLSPHFTENTKRCCTFAKMSDDNQMPILKQDLLNRLIWSVFDSIDDIRVLDDPNDLSSESRPFSGHPIALEHVTIWILQRDHLTDNYSRHTCRQRYFCRRSLWWTRRAKVRRIWFRKLLRPRWMVRQLYEALWRGLSTCIWHMC